MWRLSDHDRAALILHFWRPAACQELATADASPHWLRHAHGSHAIERGASLLSGQGANIDTTTVGGRLVFGIFAALAEFERELIRERTIAGLSCSQVDL